ncbi:MAG: transposase [Candidatus Accumulibacter phosphatis]|nr:transposase [Candidatus Accumulibacter phosphatis]
MAETVADSRYQPPHHMLNESNWDRRAVRRQLVVDANTHFGYASALLLDESSFGKKGNLSAGVARQWNGRLVKVDDCQVGVFAAVTPDGVASVVDADLYLPRMWTQDTTRCEVVGVPEEAQVFRTKGEIALDMVMRLRREGLHFAFVAFDGGYGRLPWLLGELDGEAPLNGDHASSAAHQDRHRRRARGIHHRQASTAVPSHGIPLQKASKHALSIRPERNLTKYNQLDSTDGPTPTATIDSIERNDR